MIGVISFPADAITPLIIPEEYGVTEYARKLLVNDARMLTVRAFSLRGEKENAQITGHFLEVWVAYDESPKYRELHVEVQGTWHLVHRKKIGHLGFTPFAKEHLLDLDKYPRDGKTRSFYMAGRVNGDRVWFALNGPLFLAWAEYAKHPEYTRLWVHWKDGKRRLVHRKGALS